MIRAGSGSVRGPRGTESRLLFGGFCPPNARLSFRCSNVMENDVFSCFCYYAHARWQWQCHTHLHTMAAGFREGIQDLRYQACGPLVTGVRYRFHQVLSWYCQAFVRARVCGVPAVWCGSCQAVLPHPATGWLAVRLWPGQAAALPLCAWHPPYCVLVRHA